MLAGHGISPPEGHLHGILRPGPFKHGTRRPETPTLARFSFGEEHDGLCSKYPPLIWWFGCEGQAMSTLLPRLQVRKPFASTIGKPDAAPHGRVISQTSANQGRLQCR